MKYSDEQIEQMEKVILRLSYSQILLGSTLYLECKACCAFDKVENYIHGKTDIPQLQHKEDCVYRLAQLGSGMATMYFVKP